MHKVEYPSAVTSTTHRSLPVPANAPEFVKKLTGEIIADRGNELPVSAFEPVVDGTWPTGTTQYENAASLPKFRYGILTPVSSAANALWFARMALSV